LTETLVRLTKKDEKFEWGPEQELSFTTLKKAFLSEEVLVAFDPDRRTIVECDSSGRALGAVLLQEDESKALRTGKTETVDVAWAFVREVYRHHSLPQSITSDRGPQFASSLWKQICQLLGIQRNLSTAYHPQTDGTTERANSDIEATANKSRKPAPTYQVGDWVWLDLRDVRTTRASKKLDWKNGKFQVSRVRDPYWLELAVPWETKTYHTDDSNQQLSLYEARTKKKHLEWIVQDITDERRRQKGTEYLVYWAGYQTPTWEPAAHLADTSALQHWLTQTQPVRKSNGQLRRNWRKQQKLLEEQRVGWTSQSGRLRGPPPSEPPDTRLEADVMQLEQAPPHSPGIDTQPANAVNSFSPSRTAAQLFVQNRALRPPRE
ncbi:hypothetical protein KJE20_14379, partial [Pyrenophora tritici-repentis]